MPRMPKELKYIQVAALVITAVLYMGIRNCTIARNGMAENADGSLDYVERVVDGDTLKLSSSGKVRLIGVDTPELHFSDKLIRDSKKSGKDVKVIQAMGAEASDFTKKLCLNKKVKIEYDIVKRDRYGRLLAYIYLEDGTFVNAKIVEEGYGQVMTIPPNVRHSEYFLKLERSARERKIGLWR